MEKDIAVVVLVVVDIAVAVLVAPEEDFSKLSFPHPHHYTELLNYCWLIAGA